MRLLAHRFVYLFLATLLLLCVPHVEAKSKQRRAKSKAQAKSKLTKIDSCKENPTSDKFVYIIKQWNLPPTTATQGFKEKYPHEKNLSAIYLDLNEQIKNKKIDTVVGEGCEGEITADFPNKFNGWDLAALNKINRQKNYDRIITHIPLKIKSRFGDAVHVYCGDNQKLIQEGSMRLSNLRGWMGYLARLNAPGSDENLKRFSDSAADLLRVPKTTPVSELKKRIRDQVKADLESYNAALNERHVSMVQLLSEKEFKTAALVISGIHSKDVKAKIEQAGMNCAVMSPPGYSTQDENMLRDFELKE